MSLQYFSPGVAVLGGVGVASSSFSLPGFDLGTGGPVGPLLPVAPDPPFADQDGILVGIVNGMAVDPVGLANMALTHLGEEPILLFTEDSKPAKFINQHYDNARQYVLRQHPWGSATKRAKLALDTESPLWGFANAFTLPTDFLRLNESENFKDDHRLEQGQILTDLSAVNISYVFDLTDVSKMDPLLQQAIAAFLAAELAIALVQSKTLHRQLAVVYKDKLAEAQHADVLEGPIEVLSADAWLDARFRGTDDFLRRGIDVS